MHSGRIFLNTARRGSSGEILAPVGIVKAIMEMSQNFGVPLLLLGTLLIVA